MQRCADFTLDRDENRPRIAKFLNALAVGVENGDITFAKTTLIAIDCDSKVLANLENILSG